MVVATTKVPTDELPVPTAAYLIFSRTLQFVELFAVIIGARMTYDWKNNKRFTFTVFITAFVWSQFFYTKIVYIYQDNIIKIFEVFAIYGIAVSVIIMTLI